MSTVNYNDINIWNKYMSQINLTILSDEFVLGKINEID